MAPKDEPIMPYGEKPKNTLRAKIGKDVPINKILTKDAIKECQELIDTAQQDFFNDALAYLVEIEAECDRAKMSPDQLDASVRNIAKIASQLKATMETMGLEFGFSVAQSLDNFINDTKAANASTLLVIGKHLEVLQVVVREKNESNKNPVAKEMIKGLALLIEKVRTNAGS